MFVLKAMDEGVAVNLKDNFAETSKASRAARSTRRVAARDLVGSEDASVAQLLLQLDSVDMTVNFFEDHLEFRRRLGSRHGEISYDEIRAAALAKRSRPTIRVSRHDIVPSSPRVTKRMTITTRSRKKVTFDFRTEKSDRIQEALKIIELGVRHSSN